MLLKDVGFLTEKNVFHIFIICQKNTFKREMKIHHNYFASYVMNLVISSIIVTIRSVRIFFIVWSYRVYVLTVGIQLPREGVFGRPFTGLTPPYLCVCPKLGLLSPMSYVVVLVMFI